MISRTEPIEKLRQRFKREWLLIRVVETQKTTSVPLRGTLVAHSKDRDEILRRSIAIHQPLYITCSDTTLPEGYAAAFMVALTPPRAHAKLSSYESCFSAKMEQRRHAYENLAHRADSSALPA